MDNCPGSRQEAEPFGSEPVSGPTDCKFKRVRIILCFQMQKNKHK